MASYDQYAQTQTGHNYTYLFVILFNITATLAATCTKFGIKRHASRALNSCDSVADVSEASQLAHRLALAICDRVADVSKAPQHQGAESAAPLPAVAHVL